MDTKTRFMDALRVSRFAALATYGTLTTFAFACVPDVEGADTLVDRPRVLAIRAEPAEVEPRAGATFSALYVDADGTRSEGELSWAFCNARKSLAELGPVSPLCLAEEGESLELLGEGLEASGDVPSDACRLFGPERPPPMDGEPAGRPVDPDPSGGYYHPLRVFDPDQGDFTLYAARINCGLPGATQAQTVAFNQRYAPNQNPEIDAIELDGETEVERVRPGEAVALRVSWPSCEPLEPCEDDCEPPPSCAGAEAYIYYDAQARALSARREAMRVSWFATGGTFRDPRTGRAESQADTSQSDNLWTTPTDEGDVTLWVVLRDDRGGVTWQALTLRVAR